MNHQELRKFYEQREFEWKVIVNKHKELLEEYARKNITTYSQMSQNSGLSYESIYIDSEIPSQSGQSIHQSEGSI